jgi:hypothetical protein
MLLKRQVELRTRLNKKFVELELPDTEFKGLEEGEEKLYTTLQHDRYILTIFHGRKYAYMITGIVSFLEKNKENLDIKETDPKKSFWEKW